MEINKNFVFGLILAIIATVLNEYYQFIETEWYLFIGPAFLLCLPWKIGNDIFSLFGGWNDEGGVYSPCPIFQMASGDTVGIFSLGYQEAGVNATQFIGLAYQKAGGMAGQFIGLAYQKAVGLTYRKAGGMAAQIIGLACQKSKRNAFQGLGLAYQKSGGDAFQGLGLAYQKSGGDAAQIIGLSWQETKAISWQGIGLRAFASGSNITRGTFLAIPPIISEKKGALVTAP